MASMTSPEQGAQQECISTLLRPAGDRVWGARVRTWRTRQGKTVGAAGKPLFYDELAQGGPPTRPPGRLSPAPCPEFAHGGPLGLQLVGRDAGLFHALQPHLVLHPAQRAVGVAGLQGQVGRDQAGFARQPQQGDIAQVAHQHRVAPEWHSTRYWVTNSTSTMPPASCFRSKWTWRWDGPHDLAAHFQHSWRNAAGSRAAPGCRRECARSARRPPRRRRHGGRGSGPGAPRTRRACAGIARRLRPTPPAGRRRRPAAAAGRFHSRPDEVMVDSQEVMRRPSLA